jgi:hypothetical protein
MNKSKIIEVLIISIILVIIITILVAAITLQPSSPDISIANSKILLNCQIEKFSEHNFFPFTNSIVFIKDNVEYKLIVYHEELYNEIKNLYSSSITLKTNNLNFDIIYNIKQNQLLAISLSEN